MKVLWTYNSGSGIMIFSNPVLIGSALILQRGDGQVTCLNTESGEVHHAFTLPEKCSCVTRIEDSLLFVPLTGEATLYSPACDETIRHTVVEAGCYRVGTVQVCGSLLLGAEMKGDPFAKPEGSPLLFTMDREMVRTSTFMTPHWVSSVVVKPELGVFGVDDDNSRLVLMRPQNGWRMIPWRCPESGCRSLILAQDRLYVMGQNDTIIVQDVRSQEIINTYEDVGRVALVLRDYCYLSSYDRVRKFDLDLRVVRAEYDCNIRCADNSIQGEVCEVGPEMVCFGSNNCHLWCFNRHTGELLEKIEHPDFVIGPPVFDGERLYVNCIDGTITCYDASAYAS